MKSFTCSDLAYHIFWLWKAGNLSISMCLFKKKNTHTHTCTLSVCITAPQFIQTDTIWQSIDEHTQRDLLLMEKENPKWLEMSLSIPLPKSTLQLWCVFFYSWMYIFLNYKGCCSNCTGQYFFLMLTAGTQCHYWQERCGEGGRACQGIHYPWGCNAAGTAKLFLIYFPLFGS